MTEANLEQLNAQLDDAIEDGDMTKMDELIEQISVIEQGGTLEPANTETNVADGDEPEDDASRSDGDDEAKEEDSKGEEPEQEKPEGVLSKAGDRVIPYKELEDARQRAADLEKQVEAMRTNPEIPDNVQDQLDRMTRLVDTYESQIKANGMEPQPLPEEFKLDAEKLKELEEYGTVGEIAAALAKQNEYLVGQIKDIRTSTPSEESANKKTADDPEQVVAADPDLSRWAQSEFAWKKATDIDAYVKTLPEFAGKSLSERKDEVVRRTKIELGEAPPATDKSVDKNAPKGKSADEIVRGTESSPTSLSEVGGNSARQEASFSEQTDGKSEVEIAQLMQERMDRGESIDDLL